jgi:hypothetical protein
VEDRPGTLAGNTVVLKPSPFTPLTTLKLGELLAGVFPPGVVNVVSGGDELGRWMTSHPVPRKISFTGSVATGKHVAGAAAPDLTRVIMELGGNDPAIVLDDVDPAAITEQLFWGAFQNNGQVCSAIKRVYVPEQLYEEVVDGLPGGPGRSKSVTAPQKAPSSGRSTTDPSTSGSKSSSLTPSPAAPGRSRPASRSTAPGTSTNRTSWPISATAPAWPLSFAAALLQIGQGAGARRQSEGGRVSAARRFRLS